MTKIQVRRGTTAQWTTAATVLAAGEPGQDTDTGVIKIGDGSTAWASLLPTGGPTQALRIIDATSSSLSGTLVAGHLTPVDATSGAAARTLPAASSVAAGGVTAVKKADTSANAVTVSRAGSDLIFGTGSGSTSKTLTLAGEAVTFVSDGVSKWTVQASDTPSGVLATTYLTQASATSTYASYTIKGQETLKAQRATVLRRWYAALGGRTTTPVNILFLGHSMIEGYQADITSHRFPETVITSLRTKFGTTGGIGYKKSTLVTSTVSDYPIAIANKLAATNYGPGGKGAAWLGTTPWGPITVTIPTGTTAVDIMYSKTQGGGAATFTWALDGGSTTSVNAGAASRLDGNAARVTLDGSSHSLVIAWATGGNIAIDGIIFYAGDETKGFRSFEGGYSSSTTTQQLAVSGASIDWMDFVAAIQPQLVVFVGMANDYTNGTSGNQPVASATTVTNIQTILTRVAAKCTVAPSIALGIEHRRNNIDGTLAEPWTNYVSAAYTLAAAQGWGVFDLNARFGDPVTQNTVGLLHSDLVHPVAAGYQAWADALVDYLTP